jgi:hypothetical protein
MTTTQSEGHAFIVRVRREREGPGGNASEWRGEVIHVPSQRSISFQGLDQVVVVITALLAEAGSV